MTEPAWLTKLRNLVTSPGSSAKGNLDNVLITALPIAACHGLNREKAAAIVVVMVAVLSLLGGVLYAFADPAPRYSVEELEAVKAAIEVNDFPKVSGSCGTENGRLASDLRIDEGDGIVRLKARDDVAKNIEAAFGDRVEIDTSGFWPMFGCLD